MNRPTQTFLLGILTAALIIIIGLHSCDKTYNITSETPKLINKANVQEAKIKVKEAKASILYDTIKVKVHHYHNIRHDSLIPCETKLVICDTIIVKDSTLIASQDSIITDLHSLVGTWKQVHVSDSIDHEKAIKKLKWKVVKANVRAGVVVLLAAIKEGYGFVKP